MKERLEEVEVMGVMEGVILFRIQSCLTGLFFRFLFFLSFLFFVSVVTGVRYGSYGGVACLLLSRVAIYVFVLFLGRF